MSYLELILLCLLLGVLIFIVGCIGDFIDRGKKSVGYYLYLQIRNWWRKRHSNLPVSGDNHTNDYQT
jgi:hypothetical protein